MNGAPLPSDNPPSPLDQPGVRVVIRLDLPTGGRVGPGKIALLEAIDSTGSIAAAARALGMSYPRAQVLLHQLDTALGRSVVLRSAGGRRGGGALLAPPGVAAIERYRAIEAAAQRAADELA